MSVCNARLHTITLTMSPRFETDSRLVTTTAGEKAVAHSGRYLSVVDFFSSGGHVVKTLEKIHVNFVRINLHTEGTPGDSEGGEAGNDDDDEDDWDDGSDGSNDDVDGSEGPEIEGEDIGKDFEVSEPRHLEATIDLRYLPDRIGALEAGDGSHVDGRPPLRGEP